MEEKITTKKELKQKTQEMKFEEKHRKLEEKQAIKEEKERRKNSFGRKFKSFIRTILLVIILLGFGFYFGKQYLKDKQKELTNKKYNQIYQSAVAEAEHNNYKEALELLYSIDKKYNKYSEVKEKISEIENMYLLDYISEADEHLNNNEFEKALEVLNKIDEKFQNSDKILMKKAEIKSEMLKAEISSLEKEKAETIDILEFIVNFDDEDITSIKESKESLISQYKNTFLLETRKLIETDYFKAKQYIDKAKKILPDDKDIKSLINELNETEPESESTIVSSNLLELTAKKVGGKLEVSNGDTKIRSINSKKEYSDYILKPASKDKEDEKLYSIEYNLNEKYSRLKGIICISEETDLKSAKPAKITIYNGNDIIYYSNKINDTEFDIDVSKVKTLKIEFEGVTQEGYFIAEPQLTPAK